MPNLSVLLAPPVATGIALALLGAVLAGITLTGLIRANAMPDGDSDAEEPASSWRAPSAVDRLNRRYIAGEIDADTYEHLRAGVYYDHLREHGDEPIGASDAEMGEDTPAETSSAH